MVVITSEQRDVIMDAVQGMYSEVARHPEQTFHFPTGRDACLAVGYPAEQLQLLPEAAVESFAGVGYPFAADLIRAGDVVLDIGSGSGTDALLAALLTGPAGRVYGLDITPAMRAKLEANASAMRVTNVEVLAGNAEEIPLPDESVDLVTSNGVLNLVPDKPRAFREIVRVLRPGGRVQIADIVLAKTPSEACRSKPELWAECVVGATRQEEYLRDLADAGLSELEVLRHQDYFSLSSSDETRSVAHSFGAEAIVVRGRKPE